MRSFDAKQKSDFNAKGRKQFDGYAPGQSFKKKTSSEMVGEVQQATQEAPEALEQQRIPRSAQSMAKGYFRGIGAQKDAAPKGDK